jgi:phosphatidylglycerol:prolipoprotein diacylglycerol transferase
MTLLAEPWLHDLDPFAIELPGFVGDLLNGGIRWYGLSYLAGFVIGYLLIKRVLTAGVSPLKPAQAADLVVTVAIGIVLGGRLGYVLFYRPELFIEFTPDAFPWWGALKINEGGMASHGGMIGGIAGCAFFAWRNKVPFAHLMDLGAFGAPLGLLMGRIANFVNGELYGRQCSPDFPLAVQFPQEIAETWDAEQIKRLAEFAADQGMIQPSGELLNKYQLTDAATQAAQAGDPAWVAFLQETLTPRYPSQLFAGLTEGVVVFLVLLFVYRKPVKAGVVAGWFSIVYALMRVVNELFRRPDEQFITEGQLPEITRGQWLSVGLLVMGVAIVVLAKRSKSDNLGGWTQSGKSEPEAATTNKLDQKK